MKKNGTSNTCSHRSGLQSSFENQMEITSSMERFALIEHYLVHEFGASRDVVESVICGSIAGVVAKTAIAPAERVKMSFQVTNNKFTLYDALQRGRHMVKHDGVLSLWRGHSTTVLRVAPYSGIAYAAHDYAEIQLKQQLKSDTLPFIHKFLAGSIGGITGTLLTYPLDVLRVRLALTPGSNWVSTIRQGGLFQGLVPTMLGIIPYSGTSWMVKQTLQEAFPTVVHRQPTLLERLAMNALAGIAAQFVTYPLDIVRRRMQMATRCPDGRVPSLMYTLRHLAQTEGLRGLTKGFSLNIIKGPITLSLSLTTYDYLMACIGNIHDDPSYNLAWSKSWSKSNSEDETKKH